MKKYIFTFLLLIFLFTGITKVHAVICDDNGLPAGCTQQNNPPNCITDDNGVTTCKGYKLLAPLPCEKGMDGCPDGKLINFDPVSNGENGANTKLGEYLNLMIKIFIGLCAVLAMGMIVVGGMEYMTAELISNKENGKHKITHALTGLLIVLGSYALLNTINPRLLDTDFNSLENVTVDVKFIDQPMVAVNGFYTFNGKKYATGSTWDKSTAGDVADLSYSGAIVCASNGVCGSGAECTSVGQKNCTSTRGLDPSVLNNIHDKCSSCRIVVTGGTEAWLHGGSTGKTNHDVGNSNVDLQPNDSLNKYILSGKSLGGGWYLTDGIYYFDERSNSGTGPHWHASVNKN